MCEIRYPPILGARGIGFWLRWANIWASRRLLRLDRSNEWRYAFGEPEPPDRSVPLSSLLPGGKTVRDGIRIVFIGDTGEGDRSQYGVVPLLRALRPDLMIINGDVGNPAGRLNTDDPGEDDYLCGFFQPYRNFPCSIWATPGNHDYYSADKGRGFYQVFCTRVFDRRWAEHGLRHDVLQPGTYWEASDLEGPSKLIILGLDTGTTGNLDGHSILSERPDLKQILPDNTQIIWLDERLRRADSVTGGRAVVLLHIPPLCNDKPMVQHMTMLQQILAGHPSVKLIVCGHQHNHQQYLPATYRQYLVDEKVVEDPGPAPPPGYIVSGGGGSMLHSTAYRKGKYPGLRYPSPEQWREYLAWGTRVVGSAGMTKPLFNAIVSWLSEDAKADGDHAKFRSFLVLDISEGGKTARVTPVFLDDVDDLFRHLPEGTVVDVLDEHPPVDPVAEKRCLKEDLALEI